MSLALAALVAVEVLLAGLRPHELAVGGDAEALARSLVRFLLGHDNLAGSGRPRPKMKTSPDRKSFLRRETILAIRPVAAKARRKNLTPARPSFRGEHGGHALAFHRRCLLDLGDVDQLFEHVVQDAL